MPHRTNAFQQLVHLLEMAAAREDCRVVESVMLPDKQTGELREVDVLIEETVAGHNIRIAVECIDRSRRASVQWVEEMHSKFESLPVHALILVSKKGFTPQAIKKALTYGHEAYEFSELETNDWSFNMPRVLLGAIFWHKEETSFVVGISDITLASGLSSDSIVLDAGGQVLGTIDSFGHWFGIAHAEKEGARIIEERLTELFKTPSDIERPVNVRLIFHLEVPVYAKEDSQMVRINQLQYEIRYRFSITEFTNHESLVKLGDKEAIVTEAVLPWGESSLTANILQLRGQHDFVTRIGGTDDTQPPVIFRNTFPEPYIPES